MTFAEPSTIRSRMNRANKNRASTIEWGHAEARSGIIVRLQLVETRGELEAFLARVVEHAGRAPKHLHAITDPGWWAGVTCAAALESGVRASIMRQERYRNHACGIVARGQLLDAHPDWPVFRFGQSPKLHDLRGEAATAEPSDGDLLRYAERAGVSAGLELLRMMFDQGVLAWGGFDESTGRHRIVGAVHDV